MAKKMNKTAEVELARKFFDRIYDVIKDGDDVIYELIDPDFEYGVTLCAKLNIETVKEVIEIGFRQRYGVPWHEHAADCGGQGEKGE